MNAELTGDWIGCLLVCAFVVIALWIMVAMDRSATRKRGDAFRAKVQQSIRRFEEIGRELEEEERQR